MPNFKLNRYVFPKIWGREYPLVALLHKYHFSQCQKRRGLSFSTQGSKTIIDSLERKSIAKHKEKRLSFLSDGNRVHRLLKNLLNFSLCFRAVNIDNSQRAKHFLKRSLKEIRKNNLIQEHHFVN